MKTTAALALCVLTLSVAGCTTTDETPPGEGSALAEEESSDEDEGIAAEGEGESEGDEAAATSEGPGEGGSQGQGGSQDTAEQTGGSGGESASDLPDASSMDDEICVAFFEGAAPLAAQVMDGRELVSQGARDHLSEVEFMEVDVLAERLDELGDEGSQEQSALMTSINIPFTEVQRAAEEGGTDAETGEVTYEPVEMTESEEAQQEFTSSCTSSGSSG